jgi:hypothetical protein
MPKAIIDGKDKSISPVMMSKVNGKAMRAKKGVVDI